MVARTSSPLSRRYLQSGRLMGIVLMGLGLCGAAYLVGQGNSSRNVAEPSRVFVPEFNVIEIPVPDRPVGAGVVIRDVPIRYEKFPEHQLPRGVVRDIARVRDSVTLVALPGGLPIVGVNLGAPDEASNPLVGRIPPGMRAMTVRVDATAAVEGWARSGSVVDVLLVEKGKTTVVAEQVKIISSERSLSSHTVEGASAIPSTVTLLVTQEQCLAINTAVAVGKIAFALRSGSDADRWRDTDFAATDLSYNDGSKTRAQVSGVVTVGEGASKRHFALVNGAWIPSDSVPTGFFVNKEAETEGTVSERR